MSHKGGIHLQRPCQSHKNVSPAATSLDITTSFPRRRPGKVIVHGEPVSRIRKEPGSMMDRAGQSRVERSLWRDPRLDWIPAFETVSYRFITFELARRLSTRCPRASWLIAKSNHRQARRSLQDAYVDQRRLCVIPSLWLPIPFLRWLEWRL